MKSAIRKLFLAAFFAVFVYANFGAPALAADDDDNGGDDYNDATAGHDSGEDNDDDDWFFETVGVRGEILFGDGEPSNDVFGGEIYLRHEWSNDISFDIYYHYRTFDFEAPAKHFHRLNTAPGQEKDSDGVSHLLGVRAERLWRPFSNKNIGAFFFSGLGVGRLSFDGVRGDLADGNDADSISDGTYHTAGGNGWDVVPSFGGGLRYFFSEDWNMEIGVRDDFHVISTDVNTTTFDAAGKQTGIRRGKIDNYNEVGLFIGVQYDF